jgi:hypothetical protein
MTAYAEDAVDHARSTCGFTLDYTPESVERVEGILQKLYDDIPRNMLSRLLRRGPSPADIVVMAKMYGGYIGECVRRKWGGQWERDHSVGGPGSYPISSLGHDAFPVGWCFKRLQNGAEDNVWHKFQVLYLGEPLSNREHP